MKMTTGAIADRRLFEGGPAAVIADPPPIVEPPPLVPDPHEPAPFPERYPQGDPSDPDRRPTPLPRPIVP